MAVTLSDHPSNARAFLGALAIPLTAAMMVIASAWLFGPRGPLVALALNAFLLFEVAGFSQVFDVPMPRGYFRLRRFERAWIYECLGIRAFKRLMRSAVYRRINPDFQLSGGRGGLQALGKGMRSAEAAHAVLFVLVSALAGGAVWFRWFDAAAWLMLFNLLLNGYPVMLQRHNRLRLEPLLRRANPEAK